MKNYLLLFLSVLFISSACVNESTFERSDVNTTGNKTVADLALLNESFLNKKNVTVRSSWWNNFKTGLVVSAADLAGAGAGIAAAKEIAALAAVTTGGTGGAIVLGVSATVCGVGASIGAYEACSDTEVCYEGESSRVEIIEIDNEKIIALYEASAINGESEGEENTTIYEYNYILERLNIPEEFAYLKRVGEDHNNIIKESIVKIPTTQGVGTRSIGEQEEQGPDQELPPIDEECVELIAEIINNEEYNSLRKNIAESIQYSYTANSFDSEVFFEKVPLQSKRLEDALKLYLNLYQNYPDDLDEIVEIANGYISIIETNNEFTVDEREAIYTSIIISLYSPQLWK